MREKSSGDQDVVSHPTNPSSLPPKCFGQGTSGPNVLYCPGQTHFYSKEEQEVIEQAPAWAKLMYKEIKSQAVQYGQMKVQLTAFKAVVNQRLNEHEKTQEFINSKFEDIELQNDHLNRDMDAMRESVEDREEVIQQLLSRLDEYTVLQFLLCTRLLHYVSPKLPSDKFWRANKLLEASISCSLCGNPVVTLQK